MPPLNSKQNDFRLADLPKGDLIFDMICLTLTNGKHLCFWMRISIIALAICGGCVCAAWYPISFSLVDSTLGEIVPLQISELWAHRILLWAAAIPCFVALGLAWKVSTAIGREQAFTKTTAETVECASRILFVDCGVYLLANLVFSVCLSTGWGILTVFHAFLIAIGLIIATLSRILSRLVGNAAVIREENEATV